MKYIIILTVIVSVILYYGIGELLWQLKNPVVKRRVKRLVTGILIAALLASQFDLMSIFTKTDVKTVAAAEYAESDDETGRSTNADSRTISAFYKLPDDIIEQTVPIGTKLTELVLPNKLEAVCVEADTNATPDTDKNPGASSENEDNTEDITPGEETDTEDEALEDDSQAEEDDAEAENGKTEDDKDKDDNFIGEDQSPEGNDTQESEEEYGEDTEEKDKEETIGTDAGTFTESAKEAAIQTETGSFVMPEYRSENIVEVKTLEKDSQAEEAGVDTSGVSQETIIIENITWQSEPEYDGDTEGVYIFTAVLPEGYKLTDEVNTPQITVTVREADDIALLSGGIMPIAITFDGGSGTSGSPYLISSLATLQKFRDDVNNGTTYENKYIKLTKDINLGGSSGNKWTRIGTWTAPFKGTFDGDGHTISGLYVDESSNDQGLFGSVKSGTIRNLSVSGSVTVPDSGTVIYNVAGIVGIVIEGTIENCTNYVTVSGRDYVGGICGLAGKDSKITNCTNKGSVTGQAVVGGIVGKSDNTNASSKSEGTAGTISGCTNSGTITAKNVQGGAEDHTGAGGIAGANHDSGVIKDCRNDGQVNGYVRVGGIVGYDQPGNKGTIKNCYNTGNVYGYNNGIKSDDGYEHGGIVGYAPYVSIEQCYNTGSIYGKDQIGGIAGKIDKNESYIKNSCNLGSVTAYGTDCGGIAGLTYNEVKITYCYSSGTLGGSGTKRGGIIGSCADGWVWMGYCYYLSGTASSSCGSGSNYHSTGGEITTMTKTELASGEFALYLQGKLGSSASLIWVQNLKNVYGDGNPTSSGPIPTGDLKLKVLTVTFMKKGSGTSYNMTHAKRYTNPNFGVTMPTDLSPSDSKKYKVVWWTSANAPASGKQFTADSTVTSDTTVYAYEQEMYAGESSTIAKTVTYGDGGTLKLSDSMEYAAGTSSANQFTYTIDSGNTTLKATISGDTLTIPKTAGAGTYTLKITASEKSPEISTIALGSYGTSDVTLTVKVTINKAASSVTAKPTANSLTYTGSAQALVKAGSGSGGTMQYSTTNSPSGFSTTIPEGTDAGTYTVWYKVVGDANHNDTTAQSVTVTINRAPVRGTLGIEGTLKYGETLKGNMSGLLPSGAKVSDFAYTWKRDDDIVSGADGSDYTLTKDDIGHTLTLTATAKADGNYTGSVTSDRAGTIEKADGPAVSGVSKTDETVKDKKDGTLTGLKTTMEYRLSTADSYTSVTMAGAITGLAPGTYYVRVKETDTHNAGEHSAYTIKEGAGLTVKFNSNGGSPVSDITGLSYDAVISAPAAPAREGYDFDGWYKESGLTNKWDFASDKVTENITLYAKWIANGFSIIYKDEGDKDFSGQFTGDYPTVHAYGTETVLVSPNKTGYSFAGWYTASACTGNPVTSLAATGYNADITLYAKWVDDIAPEVTLSYSYEPAVFMDWIIGNKSLVITVHVTEEGSGADEINYTVTESGQGQGEDKTATLVDGAARLTVDKDFQGTIRITCTDKDNNTSVVTVGEDLVGKDKAKGIIIEDHTPQIHFSDGNGEIAGGYYDQGTLTVNVSVTDAVNEKGSNVISGGIKSVTYQIGSGTIKTVDNGFASATVTACSFTIPHTDLSVGVNKLTVTATDNAGNTKKSDLTVYVRGAEAIPAARIDYTAETLIGLAAKAEYMVNGVTKTADTAGAIPIEESWIGTAISIVKCGVGDITTPSEAQSLEIPERPSTPPVPKLSDRTDTTITLATITGAEYRLRGGSWQSSRIFSGLTQKTQYRFEAYFPATQNSFCSSVSESEMIATRPAPPTADKLVIDYKAETFRLAQGVEAFRDDGAASVVEAGDVTACMGKTIYIRYAAAGAFPESLITAVSIPDRPAAPSSFTAKNATYPGSKDGSVTGLDTRYRYEISHEQGDTWEDAQQNGMVVTGLSAGSYRIRIKAAAGKNFQSAASGTFTIGEDQPRQEDESNASVDRESGLLTGLVPGAEYDITYTDKDGKQHTDTVTADENGNLEIKDDWADGDIDIVKKGNGTTTTDSDEQTIHIPTKEKKPDPKTTKVSANGKSDGKITNLESDETYEISKDGGKTWETVTSNSKGEITGLTAGDYQIRTKAKDNADGGTLCSEAADCKISIESTSMGSYGSSESEGGNDSGGQSDDNGGGQSGDNGSQSNDTPEGSVTSSTDRSKKEESKQDTDKKTEESEKSEQSTEPGSQSSAEKEDQTVPTETEDDTLKITGDLVATGTIKDAENITTILTAGEGYVSVTIVCDEYQFAVGVEDTVAVTNAVLTQEHIRRVNDGEKIEIRVEVKDISSQAPQQDKEVIKGGLAGQKVTGDTDMQKQGDLTLGTYIDISMFIKIGDGGWDTVTKSGEPINVVIGIPDELQSEGRTYYIARAHEGEYGLLEDLDGEADTITIRTDRFSTYAIVFKQVDAAGSKCGLCHICPTFLGICCFIWLAIITTAVIAAILIISKRRKREETIS